MPVAVMRQFFQRGVLQVSDTEAENGKEHTASAFLLNQVDQVALIGDADVEIAVGAKNDAIKTAADDVSLGDFVSEKNSTAAVGRALGIQRVDHLADLSFLIA